jgi:hypothetical protein
MWNGVCLQEKEHHHGTLITKTATQAILEVFLYISSVKKKSLRAMMYKALDKGLEHEHTK